MTVLTSLACQVTAAGITRPPFADILDTLQASFRTIYGVDAYIAPDSQDGQLLAVLAKAYDDANAATVAVYNSLSPASAVGAALSNNVRINGIRRATPTNSSVTVRLGGTVGAEIPEGSVVADDLGNRWIVPAAVIPSPAAFIDVTATAEVEGAIAAPAGSITQIVTPTRGWQTVTNPTAAVAGAPVESDAALRKRQAMSVALPSKTVLDGIVGAVANIAGVTSVKPYENDTDAPSTEGIPAHSIAMVVIGGDGMQVATAIMKKKTPGVFTHGSSAYDIPDVNGNTIRIRFTVPAPQRVVANITIKALPGYLTSYAQQIKDAIANYINLLGSGKKVDLGRLYVPAQLYFALEASTFEVDAIQIALFGDALAAADIPITYDKIAQCDAADVTVTVT